MLFFHESYFERGLHGFAPGLIDTIVKEGHRKEADTLPRQCMALPRPVLTWQKNSKCDLKKKKHVSDCSAGSPNFNIYF